MTVYRSGTNKSSVNNLPSVRPTLNLDFANSKTLDPRITFTRSSSGSYTGADGILRYAGVNEARFDHNPSTGESLGLLIEESRQNLFTSSNDFTVWSKQTDGTGVVGITTNALTSPDGTTNATRYFIQNGGGTFYSIFRGVTGILANTSYSYSIYVKGSTNVPVPPFSFTLVVFDGSIASFVTYNLNTGTIQSSSAGTNLTIGSGSTIVNYGNGWYRCVFVFSHSFGGSGFQFKADIGSIKNNQELFIYGAQLEQGSFPTSYIPTTASTVTRSADRASITGTNFSSWYNQSEGTVFASYQQRSNASTNFGVFSLTSSTSNNNNLIDYFVGNISPVFRITFGGNLLQVYEYGGTSTANIKNNGAFSFYTNKFTKYINGTSYSTSLATPITSGIKIPTVNTLVLGQYWGGVNPLNGTISRLTYYPKALPDTQLQALTR